MDRRREANPIIFILFIINLGCRKLEEIHAECHTRKGGYSDSYKGDVLFLLI